MSVALYEYIDVIVKVNIELAVRLQSVEAENASLKLALEDAHGEVARMTMVLRHRDESLEAIKKLDTRKCY